MRRRISVPSDALPTAVTASRSTASSLKAENGWPFFPPVRLKRRADDVPTVFVGGNQVSVMKSAFETVCQSLGL